MPGELVISQEQGVAIVTFREASILDASAVDELGRDLYDLVDKRAQKKLLLDFHHVKFLSSSMVGVLLTLHRKSQAIGGEMIICGLAPELSSVFRIMKLDKMLRFAADENQAMHMFSPLG